MEQATKSRGKYLCHRWTFFANLKPHGLSKIRCPFQHQNKLSGADLHVVSLNTGPGCSEDLKGSQPVPVRSSLCSCSQRYSNRFPCCGCCYSWCQVRDGDNQGLCSLWQLLFSVSLSLVTEIKACPVGFRFSSHILCFVPQGDAETVLKSVTNEVG